MSTRLGRRAGHPVRSRAPKDKWKNGGIAIYRDWRNYFLFSFCESPEPKNEHFLELKQQKNGRWGAVDGIQSGEHRAAFNWQYGTDYRMPLAVSGRELTGILRHGWPRSHPDRRSPHGRGRCRDFRPKSAAYFRAETAPLTAYFSAILQFS